MTPQSPQSPSPRIVSPATRASLPPKPAAVASSLVAAAGRATDEVFVPCAGLLAVLGDPAWARAGGKRKRAGEGGEEGAGGGGGDDESEEGEEGDDADADDHDHDDTAEHLDLVSAPRVAMTRPTANLPLAPHYTSGALLPAPIPSKRAKRRRGTRAGLLPAERLPPMPLPPLPPILDAELEARVFTHSSWIDGTRGARASFEEEQDAAHYEKLEHVGDAVLGMVVTAWLHELKPGFPCGTATKLKSHLVSNTTLSHLSGLYGFPQRMRADARLAPVLRAQTDVRAALFEAYVAAVLFSYPPHARNTGLAVLSGWLREMYDPLFDFFYAHMRREHAVHVAAVAAVDGLVHAASDPAELERIDAMSEGMALLVGTYARSRDRVASYEVVRSETNVGALWSVKCLIDGVEMGEATRAVKNRARNAAAWEAAVRLGLTVGSGADTTF
ncbi:Ribonuclease 3 [Vanrija pseudolonga]|uniref:Ribonuclease 3 n=1 Tax=Vanrija pseudolonga TaxID=143232 RepID=A0AAF0YCS1_9TREE|nr:Ribonuclease 3 [Vanrija pseudolonga]